MAIEFDLTRVSLHDYLQYMKEQADPLQSPSNFAIQDIILWTKITTRWDFEGDPGDYQAWMKLTYHDFLTIRAAYEIHIASIKDGITTEEIRQIKAVHINKIKEALKL